MPLVSPEGRHRLLAVGAAAVLLSGLGVVQKVRQIAPAAGRATTADRVRGVVVRRLGMPAEAVAWRVPLEQLGGRGIDRGELREALQEETGRELSPDALAACRDLHDVVNALESVQTAEEILPRSP